MTSVPPLELLDGPDGKGILYYVACALLFILIGLGCGYLIWKRGVVQTIDLEADNNLSKRALERLDDEMREENRILDKSSGT